MVRATKTLVLSAVVLATLGGVFVMPPARPVSAPCRSSGSKIERSEPPSNAGAVLMAVLAGLMVGIASPASSWAGTGSSRPDFQVVRPSWMQGVDAALAATKPGEIDFVTCSRIEVAISKSTVVLRDG